MPEGELPSPDDEDFDSNFFYGGSPNKSGLQSRRPTTAAAAAGDDLLAAGRQSVGAISGKVHSELDELKLIKM